MVGLINLCTPAYVYLVLSIILLIVMFCQNMYNGVNVFCLGSQQCNITDSTNIYLIKIVLIIFCCCCCGYYTVTIKNMKYNFFINYYFKKRRIPYIVSNNRVVCCSIFYFYGKCFCW